MPLKTALIKEDF